MGRRLLLATTLALGATGGALLGGCGSGKTKTVSVSGSPPPNQASVARTPTKASSTTTAPTGPTPGGTARTRTAPAPAFTQHGTSAEGLSAALATLRTHGYTASNTSDYHSNQTLRVLVGTRTASGDGYGQQVFFFVDGRYIGTDASQPSAAIKVVGQGDTGVTLGYPLYRPHDALCCPSGGQANVRFQLNNGRLAPLDRIPPVSSQTELSRR